MPYQAAPRNVAGRQNTDPQHFRPETVLQSYAKTSITLLQSIAISPMVKSARHKIEQKVTKTTAAVIIDRIAGEQKW
jgi:hypothetical protein